MRPADRWREMLAEAFPCHGREEFLRDVDGWWRTTDRANLMLYVAGSLSDRGDDIHKATVRAAAACVSLALPVYESAYPTDSAPRTAVDAALRWCEGVATDAEVEAAARAAMTAAWRGPTTAILDIARAAAAVAYEALADTGGPSRHIPYELRKVQESGSFWADVVRRNLPAEVFCATASRWRSLSEATATTPGGATSARDDT